MHAGWRIALILAATHALATADRMLIALLTEPIRRDLGLSDTQMGLVGGLAFAIFYAAAAIPMSSLVDRAPRNRLLAGAVLVWSLATAGCGLATEFVGLAAARAVLGLAQAALMPLAMAILASTLAPGLLGRGVALFTGGASIGRSLGLIGGGALLAACIAAAPLPLDLAPWRAVCLTLAAIGLAIAPGLLLLPTAPSAAPRRPRRLAHAWRHVWDDRGGVASLIGVAGCVTLCTAVLGAWAPALFVRAHGLSTAEAGLAVGLAALIAAPCGHAIGGIATDRAARRGTTSAAIPVTILALLTALPPTALMIIAPDWRLALAALFLATALFTVGVPALLAAIQMRTDETLRSGTSALFFTTTAIVGSGLGPSLVGLLSDAGGDLGWAIAAVLVAATLLGTALVARVR